MWKSIMLPFLLGCLSKLISFRSIMIRKSGVQLVHSNFTLNGTLLFQRKSNVILVWLHNCISFYFHKAFQYWKYCYIQVREWKQRGYVVTLDAVRTGAPPVHRDAVRTDRDKGLHREPVAPIRSPSSKYFGRKINRRGALARACGHVLDDWDPRSSREPHRSHPSGPHSIPRGRRPRGAGWTGFLHRHQRVRSNSFARQLLLERVYSTTQRVTSMTIIWRITAIFQAKQRPVWRLRV